MTCSSNTTLVLTHTHIYSVVIWELKCVPGPGLSCSSSSSSLPAALYIRGNDVTKLASMAKLKGGRLVREVSDSCLQFWGGMGFTSDVLVSRVYR